MSTTPYFSVVIPTYNRASFIPATLDSVLAQQFADFEVLIVDDGSTDDTAAVVKRYTDPRLLYLPKANGERGAARNYGFAKARGEYVLFLDSDDRFLPQHLATLHQKIQETGKPNFIACKYNFDRNGVLADSDVSGLAEGNYGLDFFIQGNSLACNICVRRANTALKLFEEERRFAGVEDWMFLLENTQHDNVYIVDAVTLTMNDHDARSMHDDSRLLINRWMQLPAWFDKHLRLNASQRSHLLGHIRYLCAIHAYADGRRSESLRFAFQAASGLSKTKAAILLLRCLVGPGVIGQVKKLVR
ncbi:glycosyltransferase family 2 protein [Hymenobacter jejuensis]|uniref:Glycosyltransferase family 2 protein n=1 Tax=Hymenobacter jejuensis TaxID=2502781 RepID=A0A5B7ZWM6_9BACT|nr:glycosyltransferase family 2 protein [Hymenobacter jejuensis]QDA59340.1 glycosyltransferase family 2 protein [Hymenobacter jejuensis]